MEVITVYATFPNQESAENVIREGLNKNQIACANLIPHIVSYFKWKKRTNKEKEIAVLFKTTKDRYGELENTIKKFHPYECPCIVSYNLENSYPLFRDWILENTQRKK